VRSGVPFDVAFGLDEVWRTAFVIIMSEFESGKKYNWHRMAFDEDER
jgi:hypothetical protein